MSLYLVRGSIAIILGAVLLVAYVVFKEGKLRLLTSNIQLPDIRGLYMQDKIEEAERRKEKIGFGAGGMKKAKLCKSGTVSDPVKFIIKDSSDGERMIQFVTTGGLTSSYFHLPPLSTLAESGEVA